MNDIHCPNGVKYRRMLLSIPALFASSTSSTYAAAELVVGVGEGLGTVGRGVGRGAGRVGREVGRGAGGVGVGEGLGGVGRGVGRGLG